jgi:hypothetical protein
LAEAELHLILSGDVWLAQSRILRRAQLAAVLRAGAWGDTIDAGWIEVGRVG